MIRVLAVDDHPLLREGIAALVNAESDMKVVAEATKGQMPALNGVEAIIGIRSEFPDASHRPDDVRRRCPGVTSSKAGARGYILKAHVRRELLDTIRALHAGQKRIPPEIAAEMAEHATDEDLTQREIDVLRLIAAGNANKEVATQLSITEDTVKSNVTNAGAASRHLHGEEFYPTRFRQH